MHNHPLLNAFAVATTAALLTVAGDLLAVKRAALTTTANAGGVEVAVPAEAPDPVASVIVLEMEPQ